MAYTHRGPYINPAAHIPGCPVCHRSDQVQPIQSAYQQGIVQLHTPPIAHRSTRVWTWLIVGAIIVVCAAIQFFLFIQVGGPAGLRDWPAALQIAEVVVAAVVLALVVCLSLFAFGRLVNTNRETIWRYPMSTSQARALRQVYHCGRDNVAFDAEQRRVLSTSELHVLLKKIPS